MQMFFKIGILKNFAILTGKCQRPVATLLKKRLQCRCFPVNIAKFLRTVRTYFFIEQVFFTYRTFTTPFQINRELQQRYITNFYEDVY